MGGGSRGGRGGAGGVQAERPGWGRKGRGCTEGGVAGGRCSALYLPSHLVAGSRFWRPVLAPGFTRTRCAPTAQLHRAASPPAR